MKNNFTQKSPGQVTTFAALLLLFMAIAVAASAGSKNVKAELMTAAGTEINSNKSFTLSVKITNNDMMYALDPMMDMPTIAIKVDGVIVATDTLMLSAPVAAMGGTVTLTTKPHTVTFATNKTSAPVCVTAGIAFMTNSSTSANPCQNLALKVHPTAIGNVANNTTVQVYPNPATTQLTVNLAADKGNMAIYDLAGRVIAQHQLTANTNTISVSNLASGSYIYRIVDNNGLSYNGKLAIQ